MRFDVFALAGVLGVVGAGAARADSFTYSDFSSTAGLSSFGVATTSSNALQLVNNGASTAGATYYNSNFNLGTSFYTSFQFTMSGPQSAQPGNGFAFVFTPNPGSAAASSAKLGIDSTQSSVAIQFSDIGGNINPTCYTGVKCSNLVGVIQNGNTNYVTSGNTNYATPYSTQGAIGNSASGIATSGVTGLTRIGQCDTNAATLSTRNGCMANGDVWQADIYWANGILTVKLQDITAELGQWSVFFSASSIQSAFTALGSNSVKLGFSASTGTNTDTVKILNWSASSIVPSSVPEPVSLVAFGAGLAALGAARSRRKAA